jgi:hypothetical protein
MKGVGPGGADDGPAFFAAAVPPAQHALRQGAHLLDLVARTGDAATLLSARLTPGMMTAGEQLRTTAGFALRATFPLTGRAVPALSAATDLAGLRQFFADVATKVASLLPADFAGAATRMIAHRAGEAELVQDGATYLHRFAIPNLWFHLAMAYAILRARGLAIGKADFDGWHRYSA